MTDITKIAADCATRIMDRMEMCRGSAILKGDIEREVEIALRQASAGGIPGLSGLQGEGVKVLRNDPDFEAYEVRPGPVYWVDEEADVPSSATGQSTGPFETSSFVPTDDSLLVAAGIDSATGSSLIKKALRQAKNAEISLACEPEQDSVVLALEEGLNSGTWFRRVKHLTPQGEIVEVFSDNRLTPPA
jgi:hypothetical protein